MKQVKWKNKRAHRSREPSVAQLSKELSKAQRSSLRCLCEGWNGPDDHKEQTMVALAKRGLVELSFVDQRHARKLRLRGDQLERRYQWRATALGQRVYVKIRLAHTEIPVRWKVRPTGIVFRSQARVRPRTSWS